MEALHSTRYGVVAAWHRSRGTHAGSCQGIANPKARAERSPRGGPEASRSKDLPPPFASGPQAFQRPVPPGVLRKQGRQTGRFGHPASARKVSSSADLVIEVSGVSHANSGGARSSRSPFTCDDVREKLSSTEVGASESAHTLTTGCSTALTFRKRRARARSGTRVLRTHAPKPSVAEQGPPGEAAFGPARSRRKIGIE